MRTRSRPTPSAATRLSRSASSSSSSASGRSWRPVGCCAVRKIDRRSTSCCRCRAAASVSRLSPIYYYNLSKPLVPSHGASLGGMLVLLALVVALSVAAVWLFARRDVGDTVLLPAWLRLSGRAAGPSRSLPERDWSLRSVYARSLGMIAVPTLWWTLGIAGGAAWMVIVVQQVEGKLKTLYTDSPFLTDLIKNLGGANAEFNAAFLSA